MTKRLANDHHLWVESATPGTYNRVKGNTQLSWSMSGGTFSTGAKEDFPWDPQAPGTRGLTVNAGFVPDLPDANGFTRLAGFSTGSSPSAVNVQIRKGGLTGADPADVVLEVDVYVTDNSANLDQNSPVTSSFQLVAAAAPTVFELK